ncbi:MAG TPA: heme ABC exporter ATP-binding protein CcmA [Candidatus Dormibacteraeota bacterium]|nr:heme ABC exporter ATP-binding protein CcmA [Candidatus Dormibacteraeota bacterium]
MTAAIRADGLVQRFGALVALGPLDLELATGKRLAVLGSNGAGKTTLLRILATLARPAAGRLQLLGLDARQERERLRARLGYVGHHVGLYPALTALENLEFFATLYGLGRPESAAALALVGLSSRAPRRVEQLSRGQQQRLALARAVLHRPELLVLDEPDASLDCDGYQLLGQLFEGRTVVMATHDATLARQVCDSALLLQTGRDAGDPWSWHSGDPSRGVARVGVS